MGKNYFRYASTENDFKEWQAIVEACKSELLQCNPKVWINWPEHHLYKQGMVWKVLPICYCVPSSDPRNILWITEVEKFIPTIYAFIKSLKNVRTALVSRMGKHVTLAKHQGWACVANHVLRCHLAISVEETKSGVVVRDVVRFHEEGKYILFDDSLMHYGFNKSEAHRYVLIIDFARPPSVQKGVSKIEATDSLRKICAFYGVINNVYKGLT